MLGRQGGHGSQEMGHYAPPPSFETRATSVAVKSIIASPPGLDGVAPRARRKRSSDLAGANAVALPAIAEAGATPPRRLHSRAATPSRGLLSSKSSRHAGASRC